MTDFVEFNIKVPKDQVNFLAHHIGGPNQTMASANQLVHTAIQNSLACDLLEFDRFRTVGCELTKPACQSGAGVDGTRQLIGAGISAIRAMLARMPSDYAEGLAHALRAHMSLRVLDIHLQCTAKARMANRPGRWAAVTLAVKSLLAVVDEMDEFDFPTIPKEELASIVTACSLVYHQEVLGTPTPQVKEAPYFGTRNYEGVRTKGGDNAGRT